MPKSPAKARADTKYNKATYDIIALRLRKDDVINGEFIRRYAQEQDMSVNSLMLLAAKKAIERDLHPREPYKGDVNSLLSSIEKAVENNA